MERAAYLEPAVSGETGPLGPVRFVIRGWALAGGGLLLLLVVLTVYSVVAGFLWRRPLPGAQT